MTRHTCAQRICTCERLLHTLSSTPRRGKSQWRTVTNGCSGLTPLELWCDAPSPHHLTHRCLSIHNFSIGCPSQYKDRLDTRSHRPTPSASSWEGNVIYFVFIKIKTAFIVIGTWPAHFDVNSKPFCQVQFGSEWKLLGNDCRVVKITENVATENLAHQHTLVHTSEHTVPDFVSLITKLSLRPRNQNEHIMTLLW